MLTGVLAQAAAVQAGLMQDKLSLLVEQVCLC
jgi:hypothetical protein